jgi:hypothetical protein
VWSVLYFPPVRSLQRLNCSGRLSSKISPTGALSSTCSSYLLTCRASWSLPSSSNISLCACSSSSSPLTLSSRVHGLSHRSMEYAAGHPVPHHRAEPSVLGRHSDRLLSEAAGLTSSSTSRPARHERLPRMTRKISGSTPHQIPFRSPLPGLTVCHVVAGG